MIEQYELRRNETQITIRDPFTLCLTFKKQQGLWRTHITYQLAGCAEQRQPRSKAENRAKLFN